MGYSDSHQPSSLHSLKKLRRSVSGAFGRSVNSNNLSHDSNLNENWVLSRSVPSSLNHRWSDSSPENVCIFFYFISFFRHLSLKAEA